MIDWAGLATNSLWLLGLSVSLAVWSYGDWTACQEKRRVRAVLSEPRFEAALWTGLGLFCLGVALSHGAWWERVLWAVLALSAATRVWQAFRDLRAQPVPEPQPQTPGEG